MQKDITALLTIMESVNLYLFSRGNTVHDLKVFDGFALMIALKNRCQDLINQLQNSAFIDDDSEQPPTSVLTVGLSLASQLANDNDRDSSKDDLFTWAIQHGYMDVIRVILAEDVNVNKSSGLFHAVEKQHEDVAQLLLENGADPDNRDNQSRADGDRFCLNTSLTDKFPILSALSTGNLVLAQMLLDKGADINAEDVYSKETALHVAVGKGRRDMVGLLLTNEGINISAQLSYSHAYSERDGMAPLAVAVHEGHTEIAEMLLDKGADINAKDKKWRQTALHMAVEKGHKAMVDLLLAREEINVNTQQHWYHDYDKIEGRTPLHLAIMKGHYSIAQILLEHGADVNANERHGYVYDAEDFYLFYTQHWKWTPLHSAINRLEGYKTLGALVSDEVSSVHGDSSLGQRSQPNAPINQESTFLVRLLLLHGADVSAEAGEGELGSDPNGGLDTDMEDFKKGTGITPMLLAVRKRSKVVVQLLLQYGARRD